MGRSLLVLSLILILISATPADVVHLKSGGRVEGLARREGSTILVESLSGKTSVPASAVARIDEAHESPIETFHAKLETVHRRPSIEGHLELIVWLLKHRGNRLVPRQAEAVHALLLETEDPVRVLKAVTRFEDRLNEPLVPVWKRLLFLDPENERARRALGYRFLDGDWVSEEEWQAAQGKVLFEGKWLSLPERDIVLRERNLALDRRLEDVAARERKIEKLETAVERREGRCERAEEKLENWSRDLAHRDQELDRREEDLRVRESRLSRLRFCSACRSHYVKQHICGAMWRFCRQCQGYFRIGHRCPR